MSIKRLITGIFIAMLLFCAGMVKLVYNLQENQQKLQQSQQLRYQSYLLADELRQSSDDATRMLRSYVVTGEEKFLQYYKDVLAIGAGEKPRPKNYERIYWDFLITDGVKPRVDGTAETLYSLMEKAGISFDEFQSILFAQKHAKALARTELKALKALKGFYVDSNKNFTRRGVPSQAYALEVLFSSNYHGQKAQMMRLVDKFFVKLNQRTNWEIERYTAIDKAIFNQLLALVLVMLFFALILCVTLSRKVLKPLGGEPSEMHDISESIARGDLHIKFRAKAAGVYGALKKMTYNLQKHRDESDGRAWLQEGQVSVDRALRQEQDVARISSEVLTILSRYVKADAGALYVWQDNVEDDGSGLLKKMSVFGQQSGDVSSDTYKLHQGIVGQAAAEQESIIIHDVPQGYMTVGSSLGRGEVAQIVLLPFSYRRQLRGVIELGFLTEVSDLKCELLESLREGLGITYENIIARNSLNLALQESQDLSEELQSQQEELRVSNENLREKSYHLEEQKIILEQSKLDIESKAEQLQESSRYKSEFLANMSHELRTPLNSLLILARSLSNNDDGNLSADEVHSATVIQDSGRHLLELINHILDLSKVEAGCMTMNVMEIEPRHLKTQMVNRFSMMAKEKGLQYSFDIDQKVPEFFVSDQMRLEQILTNLIANSIKFTAQGVVAVSVTVDSESQQMRFAVTDSGIGIAEDKQEAIFHAFQQADGSTTRKYGGTGLGLSISRELSELLGGHVELESHLGVGSTFTLVLPLQGPEERPVAAPVSVGKTKPAPITAAIAAATTEHNDQENGRSPQRKQILIIEDDQSFATILEQICAELNVAATVCHNAKQGLEFIAEQHVDAIVLDYMLPDMDGSEVLAHLQTQPQLRKIPVYIVSALDNLNVAAQTGSVGQLTKPVSRDQIIGMLGELIGARPVIRKKLLVVEDDTVGSLALQKLLKIDFVDVDFVQTGSDAQRAIASGDYLAVVLDLNLPDVSGFDVLKSMSALESKSLPEFVVYTARELSDDEFLQLSQYTDKIVIKSTGSADRLLDELQELVSASLLQYQQPLVTEQQPQPEKELDLAFLKDKKALLVDDDMRNTISLAKILRGYGMRVDIAPSGAKGLEKLAEKPDVQIVLMDIMMPGMDGYEAISLIRSQSHFETLPIIALTANALKGDSEKCLEAGANDYLTKPINLPELHRSLAQCLNE